MASGELVIESLAQRALFKRLSEKAKVRYDDVLAIYADRLVDQMRAEISAYRWNVGFPSTRWARGRKVVGSPRDIVDSGTLKNSFYTEFSDTPNGLRFQIGNSSGYANTVRFKYMTERSRYSPATGPFKSREMPGRDYVLAAQIALPLNSFLQEYGIGSGGRRNTGLRNFRSPSTFLGGSALG